MLGCHTRGVAPRFLQLADVAEILNISSAQALALVRSGELPAIKIGGRGVWRVEAVELEAYIQRRYDETRQLVGGHATLGEDATAGETTRITAPDSADDSGHSRLSRPTPGSPNRAGQGKHDG
jgi:excisionase family DNA binding protein